MRTVALLAPLFLSSTLSAARLSVESFGPAIENQVSMPVYEPATFLTATSHLDKLQIALDYAKERISLGNGFGIVVKNNYVSSQSKITNVYLKQTFNRREIVNADMNINIDEFGRVLSFGSSFFSSSSSSAGSSDQFVMGNGQEELSAEEAICKFADFIGLGFGVAEKAKLFVSARSGSGGVVVGNVQFVDGAEVSLEKKYLITRDDNDAEYRLVPVWDGVFDMVGGENYFSAQIDRVSGNVVQLVDWVRQSKYFVYPFGVNDPSDGEMQLVTNPEDKIASPNGWHLQKLMRYRSTIGNNVYAQANPDGRNDYRMNFRPEGQGPDDDLTFNSPVDLKKSPSSYLSASIINLFYVNNMIHDVFYAYGFDEVSGNFQEYNFGRGGKEDDAVIANAQDGSGTNNANMMTPPDGQKPRMRMYIWTQTNPARDGDLEAGIIIHEYAHGISNRLTGGPANANCLGFGESGGMGEGWGDFFSILIRMRPEYTNKQEFGMGVYSANRGIRPYPYSTSTKTNPQTYNFITKSGYGGVHAIGSVWATILYEVYWVLVDAIGFNPDLYAIKNYETGSDHSKLGGNVIMLKLVVEGMKLQPCRPNFIDARNAIIMADQNLFNGEHVCLLWKGFAKRGLGLDASKGGFNGFELPTECK